MRKALNIPLEEFLRPFFGPGERICLRIFSPPFLRAGRAHLPADI